MHMVYKSKPIFRSAIFYLLIVLAIGIIFLVGFKKSNVFAQMVGDIPFEWGELTNFTTNTYVRFDHVPEWMFAVHRTSNGCPPPAMFEPPFRQTDEADFVEFQLYRTGNPTPLTDWIQLSYAGEWYEDSPFECWGERDCDSVFTCQIEYDVSFDIDFSNYDRGADNGIADDLLYGEHWIKLRARGWYPGGGGPWEEHYTTGGGYVFTVPDTTDPTCDIDYDDGWQTSSTIAITLDENDPGGSGIQSGNVDVRSRVYNSGAAWSWGNTGLPNGGNTITDFNYTGSTCNEYQFRYQVTDNDGNQSEGCLGVGTGFCNPGYTARVDTVAPTRSISYPNTSICQASFNVSVSSDDNNCSGVASGVVQRQRRTLSGSYGGWSFVRNIDDGNFTFNGSNGYCYRFRFQATDNAGNTSTWHAPSDEVCIDTSISPSTPILNLPPASWRNTDPNFQAQVTDPGAQNVRAHFYIETTGGSTVLADAAGNWVSSGGTSCYPTNCTSGYSMSDGQYNWRAYGEDTDNCTGSSTANRWLGVDKADPNCDSINVSPASPDAGDQVIFTVNASDTTSGVASIQISVDGSPVRTCNNATICSYTGGPYSVGSHSYSTVITDNAGNTDSTPCSGTFNVSALDLSCTLGAVPSFGPSGFTTALTANLSGSAVGPALYEFDCTNDGTFDSPPITIDADSQAYAGCPGYNSDSLARVQVTREGLTADCTVNLYISTFGVVPDPAGTNIGNTIQFTATYDEDGPSGPSASENRSTDASWFSSDTGVATINSSGLAIGVADGQTIITATYFGLSDTATLNIAPNVSSYRVIIAGINRAPTASDLNRVDPPDWCVTQPTYFFDWLYTDLDNDPESQFVFEILQAGVPVISRTIDGGLNYPSGTRNNQSVQVAVNPLPGYLEYDETYSWQVNVWDNNGAESGFVADGSFTTQTHRYPVCNFTWLPTTPNPGEGVQFIDDSTCYDNATGTASNCDSVVGNIDSFDWTFEDANPGTSSIENPTTTFSDRGDKNVTLTVRDSDNHECTIIRTIGVNLPLPNWKEIRPF